MNIPAVQIAPLAREDTVMTRLLIVDDEPANCDLLVRIFGGDHETVLAADGRQALDALHQQRFDAVLLDINLPDINGYEVLRSVRERWTTDELPVILISARDGSADIIAGLRGGANEYITKPINVEVVRARVNSQLRFKRLADDHKQTIQDLQIAHKMQQRFYYVVSHDLRNILNNLRLAQYLLRDQLVEQTPTTSTLQMVDLSLDQMDDLIRVYLDVASLQPGQIEVLISCVNISDIIRNILRQQSMAASKKQIELIYHERPALVNADPRLIAQMINNLVSNAIKFSPAETVTRLWTETANGRVRIFVADQGPGIPENERGKLFEMFGKLSPRPTGAETSTGLGLWIVRHLAALQDGEVGVYSSPEGGTVFWIDVPAGEI